MRRDVTGVLDMAMARIQGTIAIGLALSTIGVSFYALAASRRAAIADATWLRQRLSEKRALVRALQADLAVVAETTERVSQMAAIARDQNVAVRRYAQVEEARDARYTPARLAALDDATVRRSEDGTRALVQLSFLEEQLAETTDSLALMTVLSKGAQREETMTPVAKVERKPERKKMVRPAVADVSAPGGWPVAGTISSGFGWRESPWGGGTRKHTGMDIRATYGAPVRVSAPGVVVFAGRDSGGYGTVVVVDHGRDLKTLYGHLSGVYVRPGQRVERGTVVGAVGNSGRATGVHLHYEVRVGNVPVDPMLYVRRTDDPAKLASR
jgi:murein DD-endopeptidase MepM/ murein hydrolase activator NlpD